MNILGLIVGNYTYYYVTLAVAAFAVAVVWAIQRSRWGYFYAAIRDDEDAAASLGIASRRMKMVALTTRAFLVGLAGSIYASYHLYINPGLVFAVHRSVEMIVVSIVGGIGTVVGPLVGAAVLIPISEYLRGVIPEAHLLLYGVFIVMFLLFLPEGVVGWLRKHMAPQRARSGTKARAIEDDEHAAAER